MKVIDRKKASEILRISVRTVDRYISKGVIKKKEIGGRIFINVKDLKSLMSKARLSKLTGRELEEIEEVQIETADNQSVQNDSNEREENQYISPTPSKISASEDSSDDIYKKLYQEAIEELRAKRERLEGANYRVGQLEGQLNESVPLLEYKKAIAVEQEKRQELENLITDFERNTEILNQNLDLQKDEFEQVQQNLGFEKKMKNIFLIILVIIFLLQPLWLLFPANS